nr:hypothetical protein CFP56_33817 [Quercus suber]
MPEIELNGDPLLLTPPPISFKPDLAPPILTQPIHRAKPIPLTPLLLNLSATLCHPHTCSFFLAIPIPIPILIFSWGRRML